MDSLRIHERTHQGKTGPFKVREYRRSADRAGVLTSSASKRQHAADEDPQQPEDLDEPSTAVLAQPTAAALAALIPGLAHSFVPSPGAADDMRAPQTTLSSLLYGHRHHMPGHPGAAALLGGPHAGLAYGPHAAAAAAAVAAVAAGVSHGNSTVAGALTNPSMAPLGRFPTALPPNLQAFQVPNAQAPLPFGPPSFAPPQLPMGVFSNPSPAPQQHSCGFCFATFTDQAAADAHEQKHRAEMTCDCSFCQLVFTPQYLRGPPPDLSTCCLFDDDFLDTILGTGEAGQDVSADSLPRSLAA